MQKAALVFTDLSILCRHPRLLDELTERGLTPIVVFGWLTPADDLARWRGEPEHPLAALTEVLHVPDGEVDTVMLALRPLLTTYSIEAVLSCGEVFVDTAGVVAEFFGLPSPGATASRICRNKLLQRLAAPALAPRWTVVDDSVVWTHFPAVLKPAGRMSSSGVRRLENAGELADALALYPAHETLLLEELAEGPEFSVESLVHDGEVVWGGVTAKQTNESGTRYFTETGHVSPADTLTQEESRALLDANAELLRAVRFQSGISHAEFRLTADGPVVMEIAARPPGDAIMLLWHLATGSPLEPSIVDLALGLAPVHPRPTRRASQVFLAHPHGELTDVRAPRAITWTTRDAVWPVGAPVDPNAEPRLCAVLVSRLAGDMLGDLVDSGERSVSVVVDASLDAEIAAVANLWADEVSIDVQ